MSLNGLDAPKVTEAYEAVIKDNGGWLLLRYVTRDEIDLLNAGTGGYTEARDAVTQYEEKSPLYGLVQYRRKQVLLKYLPEGTSRLLQARVTVHVQAIIERFAHDTLISLASATELNETTLSSLLSSLKPSASVKSSDSSLRTRRLAEIAEETGEGPNQEPATDQSTVKEKNEENAEAQLLDSIKAPINPPKSPHRGPTVGQTSEPTLQPRRPRKSSTSSSNLDKALPAPPIDAINNLSTSQQFFEDPSRNTRPSFERRQSSQSARPSGQDLYEDYIYAPKVKLGPRPSLDNSRSRSSDSSGGPRPISTLPSGMRLSSRSSDSGRTHSQRAFSKPQFLDTVTMGRHPPATNRTSITGTERPTSKAGSIASVSTFAYVSGPKPATNTPEKQRLMKALQLRKKQIEKRLPEEVLPSAQFQTSENDNKAAVGERGSEYQEPIVVSRTEDELDVLHLNVVNLDHGLNANLDAAAASLAGFSSSTSTLASATTERDEFYPTPPVSSHINTSGKNIVKTTEDGQHPRNGTVTERRPYIAKEMFVEHHPRDNRNTSPSSSAVEQLSSNTAISAEAARATTLLPNEVSLPDADEEENSFFKSCPSLENHESAPTTVQSVPDTFSHLPLSSAPDQSEGEADEGKTRPSTSDSVDFSNIQRKARRRGLVDPLRIVQSAEHDDENFLSDDSFLEELQSATLQEAKPISVSRSPVTPVFPMSPKSTGTSRSHGTLKLNRTASNPLDSGSPQKRNLLTPDLLSPSSDSTREPRSSNLASPTRAVSNPLENELVQRQPSPASPASPARRSISLSPVLRDKSDRTATTLSKKGGVSSLISQRIKALEKSTNSGSLSPSFTPVVAPATVMKHKGSFSTPPNTSTSSDNLLDGSRRRSRRESPYPTPSPSPHGYAVSRKFEDQVTASVTASPRTKSQPESISVTATIVRGAQDLKLKAPENSSEPIQTALHQSPLLVQQHAPSTTTTISNTPKKASVAKFEIDKADSPGGLPTKKETPKSIRHESFSSKRSNSSRQDSVNAPRPLSQASSDGRASLDATKEEKKESRKTRLFKRMSAISSSSRRSLAQALGPSTKEERIVERQEPDIQPTFLQMDFGDLNVQFPDTLLWKRRHMVIDGQGYLILSPCKTDTSSRAAIKRYHLSEFRAPYIPDQDRQELPNSVILDFNNGNTLQCACENLAKRATVSRALSDAYGRHNAPQAP